MTDTKRENQTRRGRASIGFSRVTGMVRRAVGHAGPDRDSLLLIVKSVIAATLAWLIANNALQAPSATFAPFTALLMVQATVSQSLDQSARYSGAMVVGVLLAGLLTPALGPATLTFAALMLVALIFGRWRRLGQQGPQVAVAALFAYSSFSAAGSSPTSFLQLASIASLVLLGCALGVITNLIIVPPMRYRSAEYGISSLAHSLSELLADVSEGLRSGVPTADQAEEWRYRANQFPDTVAQARATVEHAAETMRFNPRRLFMRNSTSFEGHRSILNAFERATEQLRSTARGITYAASTDHPVHSEHEQFLNTYAEVLATAAETACALGRLHSPHDTQHLDELHDASDRARQAYQDLAEQTEGQELDSPDQWPVYGALQTDAHRVVEEFVEAQQKLSELIRDGEAGSTTDARMTVR